MRDEDFIDLLSKQVIELQAAIQELHLAKKQEEIAFNKLKNSLRMDQCLENRNAALNEGRIKIVDFFFFY